MHTIAVLSNIAVLCFVFYLLVEHGVPSSQREMIALGLLIIAPTTAILEILMGHKHSLIGLMLERRSLEEKQKIQRLQSDR